MWRIFLCCWPLVIFWFPEFSDNIFENFGPLWKFENKIFWFPEFFWQYFWKFWPPLKILVSFENIDLDNILTFQQTIYMTVLRFYIVGHTLSTILITKLANYSFVWWNIIMITTKFSTSLRMPIQNIAR